MPILTKKEICDKWLKDKTINPQTSRKIKENGAVYKELQKKCSLNQKPKTKVKLSKEELCDKWLKNKNINPQTSRKIKENGAVYKELQKRCSLNQKSISSDISSIKKSDISPPHKKINSEIKKIDAMKKIHKLFIPYIKRASVNLIDRINYFIIMQKYILSLKSKNNCLRLYNIDPITNNITYRIGNKIILDKKIGTPSVYGIVYLSHFKTNVRYGTKFDRLNKFAVKITDQSKINKKEIDILKDLTKFVIDFICPHFPISFGYLKCDNTIKSDNSDDYSIVKNKHNKKQLLPELVVKKNKLFIQLNELAVGDLHSLLVSQFNPFMKPTNNIDVLNIFAQIFIAFMFFHSYTNCYHGDPHTGNFLYHKIKPGGYFHYNIYGKDYYLENQGFLWVIWDFGLIRPFTQNNKYGITQLLNPINFDHKYILSTLDWYNKKLPPNIVAFKTILTTTIIEPYDKIFNYNLLKLLNIEILDYFLLNIPHFTNIKPSNIINKTPYIIR